MAMRIGVLGGTFDPPHIGHLATAVNVRKALDLDVVYLVVANEPWQKVGSRPISPAPMRLALVTEAVRGIEGLEASAIEIEHGGESVSADTVETIGQQFVGAEIFVIVGADTAAGLSTWRRLDSLRDRATIVVACRPGAERVAALPGWRWIDVEVPRLDVSSSDLRDRVASGRPLDVLVPAAVIAAIKELQLYGLAA
jgi:nicotinate-nucleotide adenylyltransferase